MIKTFIDGLRSLTNKMVNTRLGTETNAFVSNKVNDEQLKKIYANGIAQRIFSIKVSYSLDGTMIFESDKEEKDYSKYLHDVVTKACMYQLGFGRAIVVINDGGDLSQPLLSDCSIETCKLHVFSGDLITVSDVSYDLNYRYMQPIYYRARAFEFHNSRVVEFNYLMPTEEDLPEYNYGGISLTQLILEQLVNDNVVQRAIPTMIEKASSFFYKIKGFKQLLQSKRESELVEFVRTSENNRSLFGAGIIDNDDEIISLNQTISNLKEIDDLSIRRLSMVSGVIVPMLVGENVQGLNSSGETERDVFNDNIASYQKNYLINPINELLEKLGMQPIRFNEMGKLNPNEKSSYENKVLDNALKMQQLGEDYGSYLVEKGLIKESIGFEKFFEEQQDNDDNENDSDDNNNDQTAKSEKVKEDA